MAYRSVSAAYVLAIVEAAQACGVDRARLLEGVAIGAADLEDTARRIELGVVRELWRRAIALSRDRCFGLHVGERVRPGTFHVIGHAALNCRTLGEAIALVLRYQRLVSEAGVLTLRVEPDRAVLAYEPAQAGMDPHQIEAIFAAAVALARWLTRPDLCARRVSFAHAPRGADREEYRRIFGCEVRFDAPEDAIEIDPLDLAAPVPFADTGLLTLHAEHADRLLAELPDARFVSDYVRHWLRHADLGSACEEELARSVHMSTRNFQRALRAEGTSWQALLDAARHARALALLRDTDCSLDEIAVRVGYSEASSFVRAFRRWEGAPPRRHTRSPGAVNARARSSAGRRAK